jgi:hypothetical protein
MVAELQIVSSLCHMPFIRKARKRSSENRNRLVRFFDEIARQPLFHYFRLLRILFFFHLENSN